MNAEIIQTYTLVDGNGDWLDTCLSEEDALASAQVKNVFIRPKTNFVTSIIAKVFFR